MELRLLEIRSLGLSVSLLPGPEKERKRRDFRRASQTDKEKGATKCDSVGRAWERTEKATRNDGVQPASQIEIAAGLLWKKMVSLVLTRMASSS